MIHIKETFAIVCERDGCNVLETSPYARWTSAGVIAYDLTVKDLTDPKLLRKLLSKIEEHYANKGYCTEIAEMEEEAN